MKKIEEMIKEKSVYEKDATCLKKSISFSMYEKKKSQVPFKKWGWSFVALLLISVISIPLLLKGNHTPSSSGTVPSSNSSGEINPPKPDTDIVPREEYETLAFKNDQDVVFQYEKNASLITTGFEIIKVDTAFQVSEPFNDAYVVDDSEFKEGEVGRYNITIQSKTNSKLKMIYKVDVVDQEILSIALDEEKTKKIYYLGEPIQKEDIYITKNIKDADGNISKKEAQRMEFEVDDSSYIADQIGQYPIRIHLKSAENITLTYQVEVRPLEEISLDGDYYFHEDDCLVGEVDVYVASIKDGVLEPHYYEFYRDTKGKINYLFKENKVILYTENPYDPKKQHLEYYPERRELVLTGAYDEAWSFYAKNDYVTTFTIQGEGTENDEYQQFVANDGIMDALTLGYLNYMYGGVYFDSDFENEVQVNEKIKENTVLYVGFIPYEGEERPYLGTWYYNKDYFRMPYLIAFSFIEEKLYDGGTRLVEEDDYKVQKTDKGYILWLGNNQEKYLYIKDYDTFIVGSFVGEAKQLKRFDSSKQCKVTLVMNYNTTYQVAINKGDTLITGFAREDDYTQLGVKDYDGKPIEEDTTFYGVTEFHHYLFDKSGTVFGTYEDYYKIVYFANLEIETTHRYFLVHYDHYQENIVGWLRFADINTLEVVNLEDDTPIFSFLYEAMSLNLNEKKYVENKKLYQGLSFIGTYQNGDEEIAILERGFFQYIEHLERGDYTIYNDYRILSISENEVVLEISRDFHEKEVLVISYNQAVWTFTWDAKEYTLVV